MEVLKDKDCTINTPVVLGVQDSPIYGKGISIKPRVDGRKDSKHFESIYLPELLPLEEYDLKAAELLGRRYGLFKENVNLEVEPVVLVNDLKE